MMTVIMGGSGSGKSAYAEEYLVRLARGSKKYYLATMQVFDKEEQAKIERHRRLRAGKEFVTIEQPTDIQKALERMEKQTVLLECMSNLVANEMFSGEVPKRAEEVSAKIVQEIDLLRKGLKHLVIVTNNVFEDGNVYDETTMEYIQALGSINERLAAMADTVIEVVVGIPLTIKEGK